MNFVKSTAGRLLIAAVCVAAPQAAIWQVQDRTRLEAAQNAKFDVTDLPLQLGRWSGTPIKLDQRLFEKIGASSMSDRSYTNDVGQHAAVQLASFAMADAPPHHPQICYPEWGWAIRQDDWQRDGHGRLYRWMVVEQGSARSVLAYWYQLGEDVAGSRDELRRILQKLRSQGRARPPLVKVLIQIPIDYSETDSQATAEELGADIYDWIKSHS
jgi:EpsI family protein